MDQKLKDEMLNTIQSLNRAGSDIKKALPLGEHERMHYCIEECKRRVMINALLDEVGADSRPLLKWPLTGSSY